MTIGKSLSGGLCVLLLSSSAVVNADTRQVDCDRFATPQLQARVLDYFVSRMARGDVLEIQGTCNVNLTIPANVIDVTLDGQNVATFNGPDPTMDVIRIEGQGIVVKNFEITGGRDGVHVHWGGHAQQAGMYGLEGNNIHHTGRDGITVHGNAGTRFGNNTIADNPGWGVHLFENANARIGIPNLGDIGDGNQIVRNGQGGIFVERSSTAHIVSNDITHNGGPGINIARGSMSHVLNNTITRNGAGVFIGGGTSARVMDNEIGQNDSDGIRVRKNSNVSIAANTTTVDNIGFGLDCGLGSHVDGEVAGLSGAVSDVETDGTCTIILSDYP